MKEDVRVLARLVARELTPEECDAVSGGLGRTSSTTTRTGPSMYPDTDHGDVDGEF